MSPHRTRLSAAACLLALVLFAGALAVHAVESATAIATETEVEALTDEQLLEAMVPTL